MTTDTEHYNPFDDGVDSQSESTATSDTRSDDVADSQSESTATSNDDSPFDDVDPSTVSKADYGVSADRKIMLSNADAPLHVLEHHGVEVPHRTFNAENAREKPTTAVIENDGETVRVNLYQNVKETDDEFGSFGAIEDDDDVIWTVFEVSDPILLKVVGEWSRRREVSHEEFVEEYEPLYTDDGFPILGY